MTIPVPVHELAEALARHPWGYLVTVTDDLRPRFLAVTVELIDGELGSVDLVAEVGPGARRNVEAGRGAAFVFPPVDEHGMSLIVDGDGRIDDDAGRTTVRLRPTGAMLHRPAIAAPAAD